MKFQLKTMAAVMATTFVAGAAFASGGASGPAVTFAVQGNIGEVIVNPYNIAPLTAVIRNGGYEIKDVEVRIVPKLNGQEIKYKVSDRQLKTNAGIPVFGLYPDYLNTVEVKYTRLYNGKVEKFEEISSTRLPSIRSPTACPARKAPCSTPKSRPFTRTSRTASISLATSSLRLPRRAPALPGTIRPAARLNGPSTPTSA